MRHLGKQRVEAHQMIVLIENLQAETVKPASAWIHHPALLMWIDHLALLKYYYNRCLAHFAARGGHNDKLGPLDISPDEISQTNAYLPYWWGFEPFHMSHRASLYRKNPWDYEALKPSDFYLNRGYFWPTHHDPQVRDGALTDDTLYAPINVVQLNPFCAVPGCKNKVKKPKLTGLYCGVHKRRNQSEVQD